MGYYSPSELRGLGFRSLGRNVLVSDTAKIYRPELIEIGDHSRIDDFVTITAGPKGFVQIGSHVHIAAFCMVESPDGVIFEDFAGLAARVTLYGGTDDYGGEFLTNPTVPIEHRSIQESTVRVGKHAVVGTGSVILPGAELGEGVAVGAMSLVRGYLEPYGVFLGIPARRIKGRSRALLEREAQVRRQLRKGNE